MPLRWVMLLILFLVRISSGYHLQSVASVSPYLVKDLGFSHADVGLLIGLYVLPGVVMAIPSGVLTRSVTDKNLLMTGIVTMILGAFLMGLGASKEALYLGRIITGIGGTLFNVILTKMVTDWFINKEIVTALAVMLSAWPIGISLGLLSHGAIAELYGWSWVMYAVGALSVLALLLTAVFYREPPHAGPKEKTRVRFGLPRRQFVHISIVGVAWSLFNISIIVLVSFLPAVLTEKGYESTAASSLTSLATWTMLLSVPLGGKVLEYFGRITPSIVFTLTLSAAAMLALSQAMAPEIMLLCYGVMAGIPAGALVALSAEAVTADNRGTGLGIFYTWHYAGMTAGPAVAGWAKDASGLSSAPVMLGAAMLIGAVLLVGLLRVLQRHWPVGNVEIKLQTAS